LALAHGPASTVVGAWLSLAGGVVAFSSTAPLGTETEAAAGSTGRVIVPVGLRRLDAGASIALSAFLAALFFGPQVTDVVDVLWWLLGGAALLAVAWRTRGTYVPYRALAAAAVAAVGLGLMIVGGAP
jgi:hypothetical protein